MSTSSTTGETTLGPVSASPSSPGVHAVESRPVVRERLTVPWWWWVPVLGVVGLLAAEVHMGHPGVLAWLPYVLLLPLGALALVRLGRVVVGVLPAGGSGELEVVAGAAHLPVRFVGRTDVVTGAAKQRALGPDLDPEAFVVHRPWVGPAVRLEVLDPDDPTPYWVVSTRRPEALVAALRAAAVPGPDTGPGAVPES